ncbi:hypothetical protein ElyMa_003146100 [Elysia marginata]|uniref:Uncharacterized protein n=1 Tax=Elysia marginata TaxID=1093978 RepID=A0AAV4IUC6_9GAST|nr:hypothetical protein ElyMa_003146100 [Elysia marginata]
MPLEISSNGQVSYSVTNLDSALTMLMAVYVYGEEAVKDTKQIALRNATGKIHHHSKANQWSDCRPCLLAVAVLPCKSREDWPTIRQIRARKRHLHPLFLHLPDHVLFPSYFNIHIFPNLSPQENPKLARNGNATN